MSAATISLADRAINETIERALTVWADDAARISRAAVLLRAGAVERLSDTRYSVRASGGERSYLVTLDASGEFVCECQDFVKRGRTCKHSYSATLNRIAARRLAVLSRRYQLPDPRKWTEREARRLMFVRWLADRQRIGEAA